MVAEDVYLMNKPEAFPPSLKHTLGISVTFSKPLPANLCHQHHHHHLLWLSPRESNNRSNIYKISNQQPYNQRFSGAKSRYNI